jgi:hypothetical protein
MPATTLYDILLTHPPLEQLILLLAHLYPKEANFTIRRRPITVKRLIITDVTLRSGLPGRMLPTICKSIELEELKIVIEAGDCDAEPVNEVLKTLATESKCVHLHVASYLGFLR